MKFLNNITSERIEMMVIDKQTGKTLSDAEVLAEVNRDRSEEWTDYTASDLKESQEEVCAWIDTEYYDIVIEK